MMTDRRITQKYLLRYPDSKQARWWAGRPVHIETEHGIWRTGGAGYTQAHKQDAWVLPFEEAQEQVSHCGPEKNAAFITATQLPIHAASSSDRDPTNLLSVIADIREKSGLGAGPMLSELADAVGERCKAPSATHKHVKRGTEYVLIGIGKMQAEKWVQVGGPVLGGPWFDPVDMREIAIYRSVDDGSLWARPREEFEDGRFAALASKPEGER